MSNNDDLAFTSTTELRALIAAGEVSPVEVTEQYLTRIDRLDSRLNSYLTVTADEAIDSARRAEEAVARGDDLGPLHGVPISIKDLELTRGIRTTGGSLAFADRVPDEDSVVVERVRAAGAVILGKTNTPEFGLLGHTQNLLGDHCRNPWNTDRTTGGSSGGAGAAVAAGLCSLATGSDGGGSIRIPSSFCGVYGIKPTQHRVPLYGGAASMGAFNMFSQSGPMTRTVADSAVLLQVLAGHDPRDFASLRDTPQDYLAATKRGVDGLRLAWSPDFGFGAVDPEVVEVTSRAARVFDDLGCELGEADLALDEPFDPFWTLFSGIVYGRYTRRAGPTSRQADGLRPRMHGARRVASGLGLRIGARLRRRAQGPVRRRLRAVRPAAIAGDGGAGLPGRQPAVGDRRPQRRRLRRRVPVHLSDQHDRLHGRQRTLRDVVRRAAHRPAHRRPAGRRGDRPRRVGGVRARPPVGAPAAYRVLRTST